MRVKYAKDIIKEIQARGSIQVPEGYITGEAFEEWLEGKENFGMSISEQIKELRETAELFDEIDDGRRMLLQAADTIEALSAKLTAANMEQVEDYYEKNRIEYETKYLKEGKCPECIGHVYKALTNCPNCGKWLEWELLNKSVGQSVKDYGRWIPCNEPPKHDKEVLIFNGRSYSVGYYDGRTWVNAIHPVEWKEIHHEP